MTNLSLDHRIIAILNGQPHDEVVDVLCTLLEQAIADAADTPDQAVAAAEGIGRAMGQDIRDNWHLVVARRARG